MMAEHALAEAFTGGTRPGIAIPMADEKDKTFLSERLAFLRRQLEYFQATAEDVGMRKKKGGRRTVHVGQVGIRCIHCAHRPVDERSTGALAFPANTKLVYQAVRNWQRYHFTKCPDISQNLKAELNAFKRSHSGKDIEQYWIESCHRKGLVDGRVGSESSESEAILLKSTVYDLLERKNANADTYPTNDSEHKLNQQPLEEKKRCPSLSELDLFGRDPSEIDDLLGIDEISGHQLAIDNHGSNDAFDFGFTGEELGEVACTDTPKNGNVKETMKKMKTVGAENNLLANTIGTAENFEPIPIDHTATSSSAQVPFDRANLNDYILQKVQDACTLVEAACEMDADDLNAGESQQAQFAILGKHLYQHFSGLSIENDDDTPLAQESPSKSTDDGTVDAHRTKRGKTNSVDWLTLTPLSEFGIPHAISSLVQGLCYQEGSADNDNHYRQRTQHYHSIKDVLYDLRLMCQDPGRYLSGEDLPKSGTLNLIDGKLYGREREISELDEVFQDLSLNGSRSIILCIIGASGTGKSALAMQLRDPIERIGGFYLSEKFDELQQVKQVPVVFSALNTLCSEILRRGDPILRATKERLESALGSEIQVLMSVIPSLGDIIGQPGSEKQDLSGQAAFMRLLFCVRHMIKCISCKEHPVVLVIDDLQWADGFSLALIEAIASDDEISSFLLVACYRDGEVAEGHPLLRTLRYVDSSTTVRKRIHVDSIDRSSVTTLISDALRIMPSQARPLANLVHSKTGGQPLFVIQFLKSLYEEGLLQYSPSARQWEWEAEKISEMAVADTVAEIMMGKMLRYSEEVLLSLKLAACLGHEFDKKTLDLLGPEDSLHSRGPSLADNLNIAVLDGLLIKSPTRKSTVYRFSHDQIQLAAYSLISLDEQTALHVQIARFLLSKTNAGDIDSMLFIIVDQFGRGLSLISDREEKTRVAELYLRAADKAMSFFAHTAAAMFSAQGISLLDEDHWRTDYQLSVGLHLTNAEANNVGGELDQVEANANVIFAKGRTFEEKLPAYLSLVQATGSRGLLIKATTIGLDVLQKLDIVLPSNPDRDTALMAIDQTRAMLESIPTEALFSRIMHDEKALFALKMLSLLSRYTFMTRRELMAIIVCRMVQLTVEYGVCNISVIAISAYAYLLANTGRLALGQKYKQLSLSLIDRFKAQTVIPQVYNNCFAQMIQVDPLQAAFSQLEVAWRTAQEYGEREVVFGSMNREIAARFFFGDRLQSIEKTARDYIGEMNKMEEKNYSVSTKLFLQATLNLMDPSCQDPSTLTGEMTDQATILAIAEERKYFSLIMQITRLRVYLAYLFRQYNLAASLVDGVLAQLSSTGHDMRFLPNGMVVPNTFHFGLVALYMARANDAGKWLPIGTGCVDKMKAWSEASPWNYSHMMQLLVAEHAYSLGDHVKAKSAYEEAIRLAREHKFIHDQALCLERAAVYYAETRGNTSDTSMSLMAEARELYIKWGALGKAAAMM